MASRTRRSAPVRDPQMFNSCCCLGETRLLNSPALSTSNRHPKSPLYFSSSGCLSFQHNTINKQNLHNENVTNNNTKAHTPSADPDNIHIIPLIILLLPPLPSKTPRKPPSRIRETPAQGRRITGIPVHLRNRGHREHGKGRYQWGGGR